MPLTTGTDQIDGYNVSKFVRSFAADRITRYGTDLRPIRDNVSLTDSDQYAEMIEMYAAFAGITAIALSAVLLLFCCANCCFRSGRNRVPKYRSQRNRGCGGGQFICTLAIIVIAIVAAATFIIGFVGESRLHDGAIGGCGTIDTVYLKVIRIRNRTEQLQSQSSDLLAKVSELAAPIADANDALSRVPELPNDQFGQIEQQYKKILTEITNAQHTLNDRLLGTNNVLHDLVHAIEPVNRQCVDVYHNIRIGILAALIIFAICALLFIAGSCNRCLHSTIAIIGYVIMNAIALFGVVAFLALIIGSDFCLTAKPTLRHYAKTDVLDYYLYCHGEIDIRSVPSLSAAEFTPPPPPPSIERIEQSISNLLDHFLSIVTIEPKSNAFADNQSIDKLFDEIREFIRSASDYVERMNATLRDTSAKIEIICSLVPPLESDVSRACATVRDSISAIERIVFADQPSSIYRKMAAVATNVEDIMNIVDCRAVTPIIDDAITVACTQAYDAIFYFFANAIAAITCFYVLLVVSIWMLFTN